MRDNDHVETQQIDEELLAAIAPEAIAHMNADHADALLAYVQAFGGARWAEAARIVALNRYGMGLVASAGTHYEAIWVPFEPVLTDPRQLRPAVVKLAQRARQVLTQASAE